MSSLLTFFFVCFVDRPINICCVTDGRTDNGHVLHLACCYLPTFFWQVICLHILRLAAAAHYILCVAGCRAARRRNKAAVVCTMYVGRYIRTYIVHTYTYYLAVKKVKVLNLARPRKWLIASNVGIIWLTD